MSEAADSGLAERVRNLPADKVDLLLRRLKPKKGPQEAGADAGPASRPFVETRDHNFRLLLENPGVLDSLRFIAAPRLSALEPNELEVEIEAACINFRDVAMALGIYPPSPDGRMPKLGCDAAGRVIGVGSDVTQFKVGDEVFFITGDSTFAKYARVPETWTFPKPADWTFEQASGLGLALITVFYSLLVPGRLLERERILIHCAAGGVGLAALQLAQLIGAEVFVTAGTEEKRQHLRSLGIQHVMDSRSLAFADQVMEATHGEGIDVVLNSIPGDAIEAGIRLLRRGGRFLELGKKDLTPGRTLDLSHFSRSITFAAVDIFAGTIESLRPTVLAIRRAIADGSLQPLATKTFRLPEIIEAFRYMTLGKHIGRIAVQIKGEPVYLSASGAR
jgi:NADPH:quinone reductase-like Zn-dependent oxidoreductase